MYTHYSLTIFTHKIVVEPEAYKTYIMIINPFVLKEEHDKKKAEEQYTDIETNVPILPNPTQLSCMALMGHFTRCISFKGQMQEIYKTGHMTKCPKQFELLKFCLFETNDDPVKINEFYDKLHNGGIKNINKRGSSLDVWEER